MTTIDRITDLVERSLIAGTSVLDTVRTTAMRPRAGGCSGDIPAPCWMPRELPEVTSHVCVGGRAMLRIRVTNCTPGNTRVEVSAAGKDAGAVTVSPASLSLGPLEREIVTATVDVGQEADGSEREVLVWIRGCVEHVVRWKIRVRSRGADSCHELDVDDCPDYVHHWYDHFYCARPCVGRHD